MQQDKERRSSFTGQPRYEERPRYPYSAVGPAAQDTRAVYPGNRHVEPPHSFNYDGRGRRSPQLQQLSPRRSAVPIHDMNTRNAPIPTPGRFYDAPNSSAGDYGRDSYLQRDEAKSFGRPGDYFSSGYKERSPQRWPPSAPLSREEYDRRPDIRQIDREEYSRQYAAYSPRLERINPPTRSPPAGPSSVQYFSHGKPITTAIYQRPPSRDITLTHQIPPYQSSPSERFKTRAEGAPGFDDRRQSRPIPQGPRATQLVSQFALPSGPQNRAGNGYSFGDAGAPAPFRGRPINRSHLDHGFVSDVVIKTEIPTGPSNSQTNSFTQRFPNRNNTDSLPPKDTVRKPVLSLRDSIPSNKHQGEHKLSLKEQMEKFREDRLRLMKLEEERDRMHEYQMPRNSMHSLDNHRSLLLSPQARASNMLPLRPTWNGGLYPRPQYRRPDPPVQSWKSRTDETRSSTRTLAERRNESSDLPTLRIDTSFEDEVVENALQRKTTEQLSTTDTTPFYPPGSEDEATESSSAIDIASPSPPSAWQGASLTPRDALVRIFVNEGSQRQIIIETVKQRVQKENDVIVQSRDVNERMTVLENYENLPSSKASSRIRDILINRFEAQEEELENRIKSVKRQYRILAKRWEQHCRTLDEQMPPEEPVLVPTMELPLTGRVGRRNRGGPSDMVHSEFDLEQFAQKQVESDRVDAELLGRQNAAEVPDMIAITRDSWHQCQFDDTNSLVVDPQQFYNYWPKDPWSEEEQYIFFEQLGEAGKKFGIISSQLRHRSVQDCVRFYYRNKADVKYMELANHSGKKKGSKRVGSNVTGGIGGLLGDIRAGEEKKTEKAAPEEDVDEDSDSAYEQEGQRRKSTKPRGRGRGRGRGGWRGRGGAGIRGFSPPLLDGDVDMPGPRTIEGETPQNGWAHSIAASTTIRLAEVPNPRKRKARLDDGDDETGAKSTEKKKPISSYWLLADREKLRYLIEQHGDDYDTISAELTQKSGNQVRNYIRGRSDLLDLLDQVLVSKNVLTS